MDENGFILFWDRRRGDFRKMRSCPDRRYILLDKWEIPTRTENKGENILPDVAEAIQSQDGRKEVLRKLMWKALESEFRDRSLPKGKLPVR